MYRAAVIGCGNMGSRHAQAYARMKGIHLVAAADLFVEKVEALAAELRFTGIYKTYEEMFENEELDFISVCTRNEEHVDPVIRSAEAGVKGIFCEKPIALSLADADRMIEACDEAGARLAVDHSMRFEANYRKMKEWVDQGEIGDLASVSVLYTGDQGSLFHNATHALDAFRFFAGEPDWVLADIDRNLTRESNQECVTAFFRFQTGARGTYLSGAGTDYRYESIILEGSTGKIEARNFDGWRPLIRVWRVGEDGPDPSSFRDGEVIEGEVNDLFETAINDLVACVEHGEESISSGRDARAALEMAFAIYESKRLGTKVDFPYSGPENPLLGMLESGQLQRVWARDLQRMN